MIGLTSGWKTLTALSLPIAILFGFAIGTSAAAQTPPAANLGTENLVINSDLTSNNGQIPNGWEVRTIPNCGRRSMLQQDAEGANDFEIINDDPVETTLQQLVHLKPGWYYFSAEIKIEVLGSAGAPPELFVKASDFPLESKVHPLDWSPEWQKYHVLFNAGPMVPDFMVGYSLGGWGSPNTGRVLFRKPVLVTVTDPEALKKRSGLEVEGGYDLEGVAEKRYVRLTAQGTEAARGSKNSVWSKRWTIVALNAGLILVAILGWRAVAPPR
jgi:hypothetical protein